MATLKEKLDAACEGRPVYQLTAEEQAWLERERDAIEAGDREGSALDARQALGFHAAAAWTEEPHSRQ